MCLTIEFVFEQKHWIFFNNHHISNSTKQKIIRLFIQLWVPLILGFFIIKDLISGKEVNPITVIIFLIISFLWVILYPKRMSKTIEKRLNHQINEGDNSGLLGKHSIPFSEDKVIAILPESEYQLNWNGIKKIVETSDYYFLYNSAILLLSFLNYK